jgi:hypothetical protein
MTYHDTHLYGWNWDHTYGVYPTNTDPAAGDTFYLLGNWKALGTFPTLATVVETVKNVPIGQVYQIPSVVRRLPQGTLSFSPVNGIPDYWALGASSTTDGVHTITASSDQPSMTFHFEETGGSTGDVVRYITGCVVRSIQHSVDVAEGHLTSTIDVVGKKEFDSSSTADAVALTSDPDLPPTDSKSALLTLHSSSSYVKHGNSDVTDDIVAIKSMNWKWDNQLNPPVYTSEDSRNYPEHAGRKRNGGIGTGQITAYFQDNYALNDAIGEGSEADVTIKLVGAGDASNHYVEYTLKNTIIKSFDVVHAVGENLLVTFDFDYDYPTIDWKDSVTAATFGE